MLNSARNNSVFVIIPEKMSVSCDTSKLLSPYLVMHSQSPWHPPSPRALQNPKQEVNHRVGANGVQRLYSICRAGFC